MLGNFGKRNISGTLARLLSVDFTLEIRVKVMIYEFSTV
jgi:hypothetical protein